MSNISSDWREVSLGEICEFKYGKSLPASTRTPGKYAVYGSNGAVGSHRAALTSGPTIIIGRKGSLGEVTYSEKACWPIDTTYYVDASSTQAHLRWLSFRLAALGLTRLNRAAAVPGLNREDAYRKRLLLPPPSEQQRLAELLDRADELRTQRRESLSHLSDLTRSIFLDMFVTRAADAWPVTSVAKLAQSNKDAIRTGPFGSQLLHSEFVDKGIAVLGIDNAVSNEFRWGERRYITEEKYRQLARYTVHPGDVLITIMGTCGRCAVVPKDAPLAINSKHLCCITLDPKRCLPDFLHAYFLTHPLARRYLHRTAKGAIMSGLNMAIIKAMPVALPPVSLQQKFVENLEVTGRTKAANRASLSQLDELFASLQDRAFRGEL